MTCGRKKARVVFQRFYTSVSCPILHLSADRDHKGGTQANQVVFYDECLVCEMCKASKKKTVLNILVKFP